MSYLRQLRALEERGGTLGSIEGPSLVGSIEGWWPRFTVVTLNSRSSFIPREHLGISGDLWDCHTWGGGCF